MESNWKDNRGLKSIFAATLEPAKNAEKEEEENEYKTVNLEKINQEDDLEGSIYLIPRQDGVTVKKIDAEEFIIGGKGTNYNLREVDDTVSRKHAKIIDVKEGLFVEDLKSTNGTRVYRVSSNTDSGCRVIQCKPNVRVPLKLGDEIEFGRMVFQVEYI